MIVEERMYTLHPGKTNTFLDLVEQEGLQIQKAYLGAPLGYFTTETGELNKIIHLWQFDSMGDREERRARLALDARWIGFAGKVLPLIARMENRLLVPTPFSAIGGTRT
ncbi:hypothetical protein D8I24_7350 [Cupriavidus necator H850]|uniref:NIPSNAP family protein n=1 Tax=Cupriavidus necator TaxID=106590 RepID=UPI00129E4133|nr:NIPSNAP family protein [Cupriavidus necator]KAI3596426.1 hypothetical protein D8I24_7350 [Cupriavidus necator H850]